MVGEVPISWNASLNKIPSRMGRLGEVDKFDAEYFQTSPSAAHLMDPRLRILLEHTHEAIMDAGFNPTSLRGSKVGVFVGTMCEDSRILLKSTTDDPNLLFGTFLSMLPNQISFAFDFHGPSLATDTACSSSLVALNEAILNIRCGNCDAAIVAGVHLNLDSDFPKRYTGLGMLSADGKCKTFDVSANGYVRSEAAVVVFICKESFARRSYAKILNEKVSSDGGKDQGILFPSGLAQERLLREVYTEAGIDPENISYIEAHGTGTLAGDTQEINAIDRTFCTNRQSGPLLIGSFKSNMGHPEPASGKFVFR
ncbi:unnamed protein product [Allacma fusca]|uniref:Fatty acid synthase n=1 Tax=Allacma fusca TaxID=39272 RepID=A0A8J2KIY8_9HEXA|nr:unnamed protein product [Allacma fusca]